MVDVVAGVEHAKANIEIKTHTVSHRKISFLDVPFAILLTSFLKMSENLIQVLHS